jgi:phosphoglycerate dehydrogenase-like enzyme
VTRPRVFIFRPADESGDSHRLLSAAGCEVVVGRESLSAPELARDAGGSAALLGATFRGGVIGAECFDALPDLRVVAKYTIGVDDVDVDAATERGIIVTHSPTEANWGGVAEGTLAFMLALLKKVRERDAHVKAGGWRAEDLRGVYLGGRADGYAGITVGIVGLGRIGRRVAELLAPWRMRVLANDPYVDAATFARHGTSRVTLETLLEAADVVTLHCSLTAETRNLIDAQRLALMKANAVLINTARGALVDIDALCGSLANGRLAAAALDVLPVEPPGVDAAVLGLGNRVLLAPHMVAANEGGTLATAIPWATDATLAALRGVVPQHVYNENVIPRWRLRFAGRSLIR